MPGLIGSQGVRPGALNMGRVFRALRYRTEQAQHITYHRPTIYKTDDYGVLTNTEGSPEILLPDLPAIIRPTLTADYQRERQGNNIIGAARIYTPNINTIKSDTDGIGDGNFNQVNNSDFNEIEGWDRLITNYRTIYNAYTSGNTGTPWTNTGGNTPESNGESILISGASTALTYTTTGNKNILEADRIRFRIKTNDNNVVLTSVVITNTNGAQTLTYTPATPALTLTQNTWLTVDLPFLSGTTSTSIYQGGTRHATTVAGTYDYEKDLASIKLNYTGPASNADIIYLKEVEFYKSVSWHVHSLKDMTDGYMIFNCVRTQGRSDSKRRAYE
jgi:hypothetical protein